MTKGLLALLLLLVGMPSPGNDDLAMKFSLRDKPPTAVGKFDKYEIAFDLSRQYDDPFDPEAISRLDRLPMMRIFNFRVGAIRHLVIVRVVGLLFEGASTVTAILACH